MWRFSRRWPAGLWRRSFRFLLAVLLLVPSPVDISQSALAPALFVVVFEFGMSENHDAGSLALVRLAYALLGLLLVSITVFLWRRRLRPPTNSRVSQNPESRRARGQSVLLCGRPAPR